MLTQARVRTRKIEDVSLLELIESPGAEPILCTRIHMAATPPLNDGSTGEPGYTCVVAELFDGDPKQKLRPKLLVDEGQYLDHLDFTEADHERYRDLLFTKFIEPREDGAPPEEFTRPVSVLPTLQELRSAMVALKDIYWWDNEHGPMQIYIPPGEEEFFNYVRQTEGLAGYPEGYELEQLQDWYPFHKGRDRIIGINGKPPGGKSRDLSMEIVETLLGRDLLHVNPHCTLFLNRSLEGPTWAVSLLCAAMELHEWTHQLRAYAPPDGYNDKELTPEEMEKYEAEMAHRLQIEAFYHREDYWGKRIR